MNDVSTAKAKTGSAKKGSSKATSRRATSQKSQDLSRTPNRITKVSRVRELMEKNANEPRETTIKKIAKSLKVSEPRARAYYNTNLRLGKAPGESYWTS